MFISESCSPGTRVQSTYVQSFIGQPGDTYLNRLRLASLAEGQRSPNSQRALPLTRTREQNLPYGESTGAIA